MREPWPLHCKFDHYLKEILVDLILIESTLLNLSQLTLITPPLLNTKFQCLYDYMRIVIYAPSSINPTFIVTPAIRRRENNKSNHDYCLLRIYFKIVELC